MEAPSILLTAEGTYPCYQGGVSIWCDQLMRGLPEINFHVFAITHSPSQPLVFPIPDNVLTTTILPLWGTEEPGNEDRLFSETYRRKMRTSSEVIREHFLVPFEVTLRAFLVPETAPQELAHALLRMHAYFREYDYARTVGSREAWDCFLRVCSDCLSGEDRFDLDEATNCMRWLQRYLAVLSVSWPRVEVTHASMAGLAAIPGVLSKLLNGSRFLLSEHGLYLRELYIWLNRTDYSDRCKRFLLALNTAVVRMNYHFADAVTSLCQFNRSWQLRLGADAGKIQIVPNGVDPEIFSPRKRPPARPTVLTMSRILPLKGTEILLRAAMRVRQRIPDVRFRILGETAPGQYLDECMRLISEHDLKRSVEVGHTHDSPAAYREADVYCLPSISEATPYSVIEAMLSGCPVIATEVGGVPELLGGTGVLVKPNDVEGLARGLLSLLGEPLAAERREALAAAALERARAHYTLRQSTECFRRIYRRLASEQINDKHDSEIFEADSKQFSMVTATGRA